MRGLAVFWLRFLFALTTRSDDFGCASDDVGYLKGEPCPCLFALPASVDGDEASANGELGDVRIGPNDLCAEDSLIKI